MPITFSPVLPPHLGRHEKSRRERPYEFVGSDASESHIGDVNVGFRCDGIGFG